MPITKKQPTTGIKKKVGSVIDRIQPIGSEDNHIKIMLYGASGTGKTTVWSTFPAPILSIICSGGNKTGEIKSILTPENRKRIKSVTIKDTSEIRELVDYIRSTGGFKTVVLDHVTGLQDTVLKEILELDELPAQKSWGLASQQDYGQCTQKCKEYCRALLGLDANVVIIGQERVFGGRDDGMDPELLAPVVGVAATPSLAGWLNPACDYILQTFKRPKMVDKTSKIGGKQIVTKVRGRGIEYCARCEPHDVFITKFRIPKGRVLPAVIVDPTFDKINKLIQGE